ncbi:hypothetical protein D3C86_1208510 [compost metagenome]
MYCIGGGLHKVLFSAVDIDYIGDTKYGGRVYGDLYLLRIGTAFITCADYGIGATGYRCNQRSGTACIIHVQSG